MDEKTQLTYAITKALAYQENGGSLDIHNTKAGKTGELKSIFQFTPATWKGEAAKYLGDANAPINADNETTVVTKQVGKWIDDGYTAKQIASMWNAGHGEPDAYTGKFSDGSSSVGVNKKYGVKFNVPAYANSVNKYATQFYTESQQKNTQPSTTPAPAQSQPQVANTPPSSGGLMQQAAWKVPWLSQPPASSSGVPASAQTMS